VIELVAARHRGYIVKPSDWHEREREMPKLTIYFADEEWKVLQDYRSSVRPIPSSSVAAKRMILAGAKTVIDAAKKEMADAVR
jgi:hypothetical protein